MRSTVLECKQQTQWEFFLDHQENTPTRFQPFGLGSSGQSHIHIVCIGRQLPVEEEEGHGMHLAHEQFLG